MIFHRFQTLKGFQRDPVRGRFPSQRLSVLLPLTVLPLELSPKGLWLELLFLLVIEVLQDASKPGTSSALHRGAKAVAAVAGEVA